MDHSSRFTYYGTIVCYVLGSNVRTYSNLCLIKFGNLVLIRPKHGSPAISLTCSCCVRNEPLNVHIFPETHIIIVYKMVSKPGSSPFTIIFVKHQVYITRSRSIPRLKGVASKVDRNTISIEESDEFLLFISCVYRS
jgi:hypothetical protein